MVHVELMVRENLPATHTEQVADPAVEKRPATQTSHVAFPPGDAEPAEHGTPTEAAEPPCTVAGIALISSTNNATIAYR